MESIKNDIERVLGLVELEEFENYLLSLGADRSERVNNIINVFENEILNGVNLEENFSMLTKFDTHLYNSFLNLKVKTTFTKEDQDNFIDILKDIDTDNMDSFLKLYKIFCDYKFIFLPINLNLCYDLKKLDQVLNNIQENPKVLFIDKYVIVN